VRSRSILRSRQASNNSTVSTLAVFLGRRIRSNPSKRNDQCEESSMLQANSFRSQLGKSAILFAVPRLPLMYRVGEYNGTCVYSQQIAKRCFVPIVFSIHIRSTVGLWFLRRQFYFYENSSRRDSRQSTRFMETKPEEELEHIGRARFVIFFRNICVCVCLYIFECVCLFSYKTYD